MTPTEVRKLISLAEHGKTRDMAIYAQYCGKLDALQAQIDCVHTDKRKHDLSRGGDLNTFARWQRWAGAEIAKLQSQHYDAKAEKEAARLVALRSVAKVQALEILLKRALKEEVMTKRRRAEQNGQPPDA
ncbi:MAG: hypothetical protein COA53_09170 [Rhodobacteraceae bacterium]|nr:MAG: hypothetical protein COA53_09170 [Paracoccaceae bacterium]